MVATENQSNGWAWEKVLFRRRTRTHEKNNKKKWESICSYYCLCPLRIHLYTFDAILIFMKNKRIQKQKTKISSGYFHKLRIIHGKAPFSHTQVGQNVCTLQHSLTVTALCGSWLHCAHTHVPFSPSTPYSTHFHMLSHNIHVVDQSGTWVSCIELYIRMDAANKPWLCMCVAV